MCAIRTAARLSRSRFPTCLTGDRASLAYGPGRKVRPSQRRHELRRVRKVLRQWEAERRVVIESEGRGRGVLWRVLEPYPESLPSL